MAHLTLLARTQRGVVLIASLIMVIAVTVIAVTLMSSSTIDIKITNAAQEREVAENELIGEVQKLIASEVNKGAASIFFLTQAEAVTLDKDDVIKTGKVIDGTRGNISSTLTNLNNGELELYCPRRYSYTAGISCNMVQLSTTTEYGSKNKHTLTIVTGIAQEMANIGKGI